MSIPSFRQYKDISESLSGAVTSELKGKASREAKRLGLKYIGFSRYADKSGNVTHVAKGDKLIPYTINEETKKPTKKPAKKDVKPSKEELERKAAMDTASADREIDKQTQAYQQSNAAQIIQTNQALIQLYDPSLFSDEQIDAILAYVNGDAATINRYLYKGFDDVTDQNIAMTIGAEIDALDSAFDGAGAPMEYTVYTALSARYTPDKMKVGSTYIFRGFVSTSLDHNVITDQFAFSEGEVNILLELTIRPNQKALYLEGFASEPQGDFETLLPRGTTIQITSGPNPVDPSLLGQNIQTNIALFSAEIIG